MAVQVVNDSEFKDKLEEKGLVAVKYYADWCGSCRLFAPKFRRLSEDSRFDNIDFIDINAEQNPEARKLAGVTNLPYFAVFKEGQLVEGAATIKEEMVVELLNRLN